jgi:hypothetical protein
MSMAQTAIVVLRCSKLSGCLEGIWERHSGQAAG